MREHREHRKRNGFTLIELSIVLVIIGLIVGGILTGQDLIKSATVRAEVTQIEKFQTATVTFREKYGALPGDITPQAVTQFGFTADPFRAGTVGEGDGNGELDGGAYSFNQKGENIFFWEDLSTNSHLIEGGFNTTTSQNSDCASNTACSANFPYAKIGNGSFVYVYSGYAANCCPTSSANWPSCCPYTGAGANFFGLAVINSMGCNGNVGCGASAPALTVSQAYAIDSKIDDGLPTTGNVLAQYLGNGGYANSGIEGWSVSGASPSSTTCYDTSSGTAAYSIGYKNGNNVTCGISFKFQAGD